jgi:hypothetical protein
MSHSISADVVQAVQTILEQHSPMEGPITKWGKVLDVLKYHKLAYMVENVSPNLVLVHPDNRSKLGVNPHNCHRTGAYIHRVGADLELLKKATAFEINPMDPVRSTQLDFNRKLVEQSHGMLAKVTGSERYVSVGCGHTTQFCKAALASCRTPEPSLADSSGFLNVQQLVLKDPAMRVMLEQGWAWTIVAWQCESAWPLLPDLAQRALNAANTVASQASELEVAASISEFAQLMQDANKGAVDWKKCCEAASSSMPPCVQYIDIVAEYVRLYGGGPGAPMIKYLDQVAKAYGENIRLGEDYLKAVTECNFGPTRKCPHTRTALIAANLVSKKVTDGIAKLLVKSDVERLKSKDLRATVPLTCLRVSNFMYVVRTLLRGHMV